MFLLKPCGNGVSLALASTSAPVGNPGAKHGWSVTRLRVVPLPKVFLNTASLFRLFMSYQRLRRSPGYIKGRAVVDCCAAAA